MNLELIGIATVLLGAMLAAKGTRGVTYMFVISTLLGASAALVLTALSGASIQPAHLTLGFVAASIVLRGHLPKAAPIFAFPQAGFWLALTCVVTVLSAVFLPQLFENATYVYTVTRASVVSIIALTPLRPVSGNITQSIYFIGDVAAFALLVALAADRSGKAILVEALLLCASVNLVFGMLDLGSYLAGLPDPLAFLRNANYRMLNDAEAGGFKRVVGSFPEASTFGSTTLGLFAFTFSLWLRGTAPRLTGLLTVLSIAFLLLSTSTTAYGGLGVYLALVYGASLWKALAGRADPRRIAFLVFAPLALLAGLLALQLSDSATRAVGETVDQLLFNKLQTESGIERSAWNRQAIVNFIETWGFGAGVGSVRASSFFLAVPANIGVIGALCYAAFLFRTIAVGEISAGEDPPAAAVREAGSSACIALVVAAAISGGFIDLGLNFFVFAALACAPAEAGRRVSRAPGQIVVSEAVGAAQ